MPGNKHYKGNIWISPMQGKTLAGATALGKKEESAFKDFVKGSLDMLYSCGTGKRLIDEMNATPHKCTIFAGGPNDDNCAKAYPDDIPNGIARMAINFRPFQKGLAKMVKEMKHPVDGKGLPKPMNEAAPLIQQYKDMKEDRRQIGEKYGLPTTATEANTEFLRVLKRTQAKGGHALFDRALANAGLTVGDIKAVFAGTRKLDDDEYFKLCAYLYDFLTPGPGCPTQVRVQLASKFKAGFKNEYKEIKWGWLHTDKKAWNRIGAVIIGHELVHAWRMMTGRRLVDDGYEEELMTVGCALFANFPLTENAIRRDLKLATRSGYQPLARYYSELAATIMLKPETVVDVI